MQAQPRSRPGNQARPGDVTGRKREQLSAEQAEEINRRQGEMAMITAERQRAFDEDVVDPLTREIIKPSGDTISMDAEPDDAPRLISTGAAQIEELPDPKPNISAVGTRTSLASDPDEKVIIRVNCDLDEVTLGYGNTVSFKQGGKYRVPRWVANHLEEKGLVWH